MSSRRPVSTTWAKRVLGSTAVIGAGDCRPAAGASPLGLCEPVGETSGGSGAALLGAMVVLGLGPGSPVSIRGSAGGSVAPGRVWPPVPNWPPPTTIATPGGRSVAPLTCTEAATGLLADTSRSACGLRLITRISTGALPPAGY